MPLPYISIDNFRVFKEKTEFEFAPITILTGTNCSGKSSLVDALRILEKYFFEIGNKQSDYEFENHFWKSLTDFKVEFLHSKIPGFEFLPNNKSGKDNIVFEFKRKMKGIGNVILVFQFRNGNIAAGDGILESFKILNSTNDTFFELINTGNENYNLIINYEYLLATFEKAIQKEIGFYNTFLESFFNYFNLESEEEYIKKYKEKEYTQYTGYDYWADIDLMNRLNNIYPELLLYYQFRDSYGCFPVPDYWKQLMDENVIIPIINFGSSEFDNCTVIKPSPEELFAFRVIEENFEKKEPFYKYSPQNKNKKRVEHDINVIIHSLSEKIGLKNIDLGTIEKEFLKKSLIFEIRNIPFSLEDKYGIIDEILHNPLLALFKYKKHCILHSGNIDILNFYKEMHDKKLLQFAYDGNESTQKFGVELISTDLAYLFFNDFIYKNIKDSISYLKYSHELHYIPSIRNNPQRFYGLKDDAYFEKILNDFIRKNTISIKNVSSFLNDNLKRFGIGNEIEIERKGELGIYTVDINIDGMKVNMSDCGYGVSQLLPILLKICIDAGDRMYYIEDRDDVSYPDDRTLFIIEEPETNLHPALQSKLADMLIEASELFHIQFIIETHSEYLIRRLQGMIANRALRSEKVKIYYFHHPDHIPEGEPQVYQITIEQDGALSKNFGKGFYDEAANLNIALYNYTSEQHN